MIQDMSENALLERKAELEEQMSVFLQKRDFIDEQLYDIAHALDDIEKLLKEKSSE